ncbi:MAG TPA: Mur ligase domain-containing protein [Candidatus Saccharimonadales bacterium]|nr:Mur ligase domain-containing protein [Candidatus Saccharimonadales bacterium]
MNVFFSGIGGTAIGPLALIAHQAGYNVYGSDKQNSQYIEYLKKKGLGNIHIGQSSEDIAKIHEKSPIDWFVYSSAVSIEDPSHPELSFVKEKSIKLSKRDEFLNKIIEDSNKKLIAIAGTHGKTTTTAMAIWLFKELGIPISYSVGAKIPFGDMGYFDEKSEYFIYECDEFDRNFLAFKPFLSLISGIDYDHHEIFPTKESYIDAFKQFISQSSGAFMWQDDFEKSGPVNDNIAVMSEDNELMNSLNLAGWVNRKDGALVVSAAQKLTGEPSDKLIEIMNEFPGLSRRFEKITENLYSDYAHTIPKIKGCLQMAEEVSDKVVIVYEPLTDRRQHYIKDEYKNLFKGVKELYWVPSYLAREDPKQKVITPQEFIDAIEEPADREAMELDDKLKNAIQKHLDAGDSVVCISGGGGGSLDEWLRTTFSR